VYFQHYYLMLPHCHLGVVVSQTAHQLEPSWLSSPDIRASTSYVNTKQVVNELSIQLLMSNAVQSSATTLVSVTNNRVVRAALTALANPHTLWRRITRIPSPRQRVALHSICTMYFSHWMPPGVSEKMWSVNLDASISGEYQTLGGHSWRPSE